MKKLSHNQQGIVSIFVATMLILIVSLLALAFSQIARREQRESLDTQLSTQAFYAAESGVNDAKQSIVAKLAAGDVPEKKNCSPSDAAEGYSFNGTLGDGVSYTCVLINPTPKEIHVPVTSDDQVVPIKSGDGTAFKTLTFSWTGTNAFDAASLSSCPVAGIFKPAASWSPCPFGGLRIELVNVDAGLSTAALIDHDMTAFFMPTTNGTGTISFVASNVSTQDSVVGASSCSSGTCTVTINGLSSANYYLRIRGLYSKSNLVITGNSVGSGPAATFKGAQVAVDATGKAQDVLRRMVVYVPLQKSNGKVPSAAITSNDSICKKFQVNAGFYNDVGGCDAP